MYPALHGSTTHDHAGCLIGRWLDLPCPVAEPSPAQPRRYTPALPHQDKAVQLRVQLRSNGRTGTIRSRPADAISQDRGEQHQL